MTFVSYSPKGQSKGGALHTQHLPIRMTETTQAHLSRAVWADAALIVILLPDCLMQG